MTLEEDEFSQKQRLAYKLEQVHNIIASEGHWAQTHPNRESVQVVLPK
jgi:hypothetical protein